MRTKRNYRMDTPKGRVQHAFDHEGEEAGSRLATELGVSSKFARWQREWTEAAPPKVTAPKSTRVRILRKGEDYQPERGHRVALRLDKERSPGTVTDAGKEQSVVRWDHLPGAQPQAELNQSLIPIT